MRKAQGLSMNYVIVGIIALVVLVVIIIIFVTGMREPSEFARGSPEYAAANACDTAGGVWHKEEPDSCNRILQTVIKAGFCCKRE